MARFNRLEFPEDAPPVLQKDGKQDASQAPASEKRYRNSAADWMREADAQRRLGRYEAALRAYGRALEAERSQVAAWVGQAQMLILLDEARQAEMWTVSGLKVFPNNADLLAARAQALCRLGDTRSGMQYNDAAIQGEGNSAYRWTVRGELMTANRSNNAAHCFDSAEQIDGDWLIRTENANVLRHYGLPLKGLARAAAAVNMAQDAPFAWMVKGVCEFESGFNKQAEQSLTTALELLPDFKEAKNWLASVKSDVRLFRRFWNFFRRR